MADDGKFLKKLRNFLGLRSAGDPYTCVRPGCSNRSLMPYSYCLTGNNCAREDAPRLGKVSQRATTKRAVQQPAHHVRRGAGTGVTRAVRDAQVQVFHKKYPSYKAFLEGRKTPVPDGYADMREVATTVHNLACYYKCRFPKDCKGNEARAAFLQGWASAQADRSIAEHVRDSLAAAMQRDFDKQERSLEPIELLEAMKARANGRRA